MAAGLGLETMDPLHGLCPGGLLLWSVRNRCFTWLSPDDFFFFAKWWQVVSSLLLVFSELVCARVCVITSLHPSDYFLHLTVNNDRRRSRFSATRLHNIYCACASRLLRLRPYLQITFKSELKLRLWTSFSRTMTWSKLCSALLRMIQWNVSSCL